MKVRYLESARDDIAWFRNYYGRAFPSGKGNARARLQGVIQLISEHPNVGHPPEDFKDALDNSQDPVYDDLSHQGKRTAGSARSRSTWWILQSTQEASVANIERTILIVKAVPNRIWSRSRLQRM